MSKISKSQLLKLQVLQAVQNLVKGGLYRSCVCINTSSIKTLLIQVYCKKGVWTPYLEDCEPIEEGGMVIGHFEGDLNKISSELDKYTLTSFTVYHG